MEACENISVILPCLNEAEHIERALQSASTVNGHTRVQILVVDGHSKDASALLAQAQGAQVISTAPSRSRQMNAGAEAATGDLLLFLHADGVLPDRYDEAIQKAQSRSRQPRRWGAFETIKLDVPGWRSNVLQAAVRLRSRLFHLPYGDQAIFVEGDLFRSLGGFKQMPLLEDVELVCRLRRLGPPLLVPVPIMTSARRWQRLGLLQTTIINQMILVGWRLGINVQILANWYNMSGRQRK